MYVQFYVSKLLKSQNLSKHHQLLLWWPLLTTNAILTTSFGSYCFFNLRPQNQVGAVTIPLAIVHQDKVCVIGIQGHRSCDWSSSLHYTRVDIVQSWVDTLDKIVDMKKMNKSLNHVITF